MISAKSFATAFSFIAMPVLLSVALVCFTVGPAGAQEAIPELDAARAGLKEKDLPGESINADSKSEEDSLKAQEKSLLDSLNNKNGDKPAPAPELAQPVPAVSNSVALDSNDATDAASTIEVVSKPKRKIAPATKAASTSAAPSLQTSGEGDRELKEAFLDMTRELEETRNRLITAETEVERLSQLLNRQRDAKLSSFGAKIPAPRQAITKQIPRREVVTIAPKKILAEASSDMPIITVSADKAHLRTGPGMEHSPLMAIPRGSRLAVETRQNDWYRVVTPTGGRAWISGDVVEFITGVENRVPASAARIQAIEARP